MALVPNAIRPIDGVNFPTTGVVRREAPLAADGVSLVGQFPPVLWAISPTRVANNLYQRISFAIIPHTIQVSTELPLIKVRGPTAPLIVDLRKIYGLITASSISWTTVYNPHLCSVLAILLPISPRSLPEGCLDALDAMES